MKREYGQSNETKQRNQIEEPRVAGTERMDYVDIYAMLFCLLQGATKIKLMDDYKTLHRIDENTKLHSKNKTNQLTHSPMEGIKPATRKRTQKIIM